MVLSPDEKKRLAGAKVLVVGAGGLGSPAALTLAAAGVGHLTLCDPDRVELSNLQRQVLFRTSTVGDSKAEAGARRLTAVRPDVRAVPVGQGLGPDNAEDLIRNFDLVVDGVDNAVTRYVVNDTCLRLGKSFVEAGILRFNGLLLSVTPGQGPCFRCLFPEPPPPECLTGCSQAGILGSIAGVIGSLQALEALRLILGRPGRLGLITFDGLSPRFRQISWPRRPGCPACAKVHLSDASQTGRTVEAT